MAARSNGAGRWPTRLSRSACSTAEDATIVRVLNHLHLPLDVLVLIDDSLERCRDALVRAERLGDPVLLFWAASWNAETVCHAGHIEEMDRCMAIAATLAERLDQPTLRWLHTYQRATRAADRGRHRRGRTSRD